MSFYDPVLKNVDKGKNGDSHVQNFCDLLSFIYLLESFLKLFFFGRVHDVCIYFEIIECLCHIEDAIFE